MVGPDDAPGGELSARRALVTGIGGQDGSYLAELLLAKGYEVHGMVRRGGSPLDRIAHIARDVAIHTGDLRDERSLHDVVRASRPDEVYNLAGNSFVGRSWEQPVATAELTATGVIRLLEAIKQHAPEARFYQASSSEVFGTPEHMPQDERTPIHPRTPYGAAKAYGHHISVNYRDAFGLFACVGILFNHESPRRGTEFVTRKITQTAAAIKLGIADELALGALDAERDWGYARDYVEAMWRMLQQETPDDYVIATGVLHSVRDVVDVAFGKVGLDPADHVRQDERFLRPSEPHRLVGDASKARAQLGWEPTTTFEALIESMVEADLDLLESRPQAQTSN
jgi:GDPmannose 4,6-dehydratase